MPRITGLGKPDARGRYYYDLGLEQKDSGKLAPHRFIVGTDRAEAEIRYNRLEQVWTAVECRWFAAGRPGGKATWDAVTLRIGIAVAKGEETVKFLPWELPLPAKPEGADDFAWCAKALREVQLDLTAAFRVKVVIAEEDGISATGQQQLQGERDRLDGLLNVASGTGQGTLFGQLDRFGQGEAATYAQTSEYGIVVLARIKFLKSHIEDCALRELDIVRIAKILETIRHRPLTAKGKPCSLDYARGLSKTFRAFLNWLEVHAAWKRPPGKIPAREYVRTPEENAKSLIRRVHRIEELTELWRNAGNRERLYMALALNCGMGAAELATLQVSEIHLREGEDRGHIKRLRTKTRILTKWALWPETIQLIRWWMKEHRPKESFFGAGRFTTSNRRKQHFNNSMNTLIARASKGKDWHGLSFNKLKKTGASRIRRWFGDSMASQYIAHGKTSNDPHLENYADRSAAALKKALARLRRWLAPMFTAGVPLRAGTKLRLPLATREEIKEARRGGMKYAEIKAKWNVGYNTITKLSNEIKEERK